MEESNFNGVRMGVLFDVVRTAKTSKPPLANTTEALFRDIRYVKGLASISEATQERPRELADCSCVRFIGRKKSQLGLQIFNSN